MNQEKFNLTWHTYTDHLREMLHDMMSSNELTDVTLVSEDKKQFKVHKVVLSASSPVFKSIISDNILSSPIIYLKGIQSMEIESILQFLYLGEATLYRERMNELLTVAKSLEIKEISIESEIPENEQLNDDEKQQFDQTSDLPANNDEMENIVENEHINKQRQVRSNYGNIYPCEQCNYKATHLNHLKRHIKSIHDEIKYPCDQCSYKATQLGVLKRHIKSIHYGVKYPCDQCNFKATYPHHLRRHIKSIHDEVKYPCDQCNYMASRPDTLQQHIKLIHREAKNLE